MTASPGPGPIVTLVAFFILGGLATAAAGPAAPGAGGHALLEAGGSASCGPAIPASGVQGSLTIDGGPLAPSAAGGLTLTYTYVLRYQTVETPGNISFGSGCVRAEGNATTTQVGSFSFVPPIPPTTCTAANGAELCTMYSEPAAPVGVSLAAGVPSGYAVTVAGSSSPITVTLIYQLASVTVAPGGPTVTTSVGAPTGFAASAWTANGSATGLPTTFSWNVNGTGWSFDGPAVGPSVHLTAVDGASAANVTVRADASVNGAELTPVTATVHVVAIPTEIETGEANRTVLDAGGMVGVRLTALGAGGFPYSAFVEPGLGLSEVAAPCRTGSTTGGTVEVVCAASITYPSAGTAQPYANVTNGYSSALWPFPNIEVHPPPDVQVGPAAPIGYALAPIAITVTAVNGSGAPPYVRACLAAPPAPTTCLGTPGPSWSFSRTFDLPGNYSAIASAVDADGTNASTALTVEVVPALALGPVATSGPNVTAEAVVDLHATVSGGVLPLHYWWNISGLAGPLLDGDLSSDGTLTATDVPAVAGPMMVTLTVLDRLGTIATSELLLSVGPAAAERIAPVLAPPAGPVVVGTSVPLAWGAFDPMGAADTSFAAAVELNVGSTAAQLETWVNASAVGPLAPVGGGRFGVPANAWVDGVLEVNLTVGTAAANVTIGLSGASLPGAVASMSLSVEPDRAHVRLFSPTVVHAGARTNATLWRAEDRFGNPVPGALFTVELSFGGERDDVVVAAITLPDGGSGVWVNYSAPTGGDGRITIVDAAGAVVLGPLFVPAARGAPPPDPTVDALATVVPLSVAGAATFAVMRRRRRARETAPVEEELRRLAEGRTRAVELIGRAGALDLPGLEEAWGQPVPPALADWLASLVADGTVRATIGDDGRARFCLAHGSVGGPRVTFDPEVLDRSLRLRDEALDDPGGNPGESPP